MPLLCLDRASINQVMREVHVRVCGSHIEDTCWPVRLWGLDIFGYGDRLLLVRSKMFRVVGARWSHSFATIIVSCFDLTMTIFNLGHWYYGEECILDLRWIPCYRDTTSNITNHLHIDCRLKGQQRPWIRTWRGLWRRWLRLLETG